MKLLTANGKLLKTTNGFVTAPPSGNKLPLVVGTQSASNLYDITAEDLEGVTEIREYAFRGCSSLRSIVLPNELTEIKTATFLLCTSLTDITIPNKVTSIGTDAFYQCTSLESIIIPDSVTRIEQSAFNYCRKMRSLTIGSGVTNIAKSALQCGQSFKTTFIMKPTTPPSIQSATFYIGYINQIIVPKGTLETYKTATNWSQYASKMVEATE